jgi:hypothetical protein
LLATGLDDCVHLIYLARFAQPTHCLRNLFIVNMPDGIVRRKLRRRS